MMDTNFSHMTSPERISREKYYAHTQPRFYGDLHVQQNNTYDGVGFIVKIL